MKQVEFYFNKALQVTKNRDYAFLVDVTIYENLEIEIDNIQLYVDGIDSWIPGNLLLKTEHETVYAAVCKESVRLAKESREYEDLENDIEDNKISNLAVDAFLGK